MAMNTDTVEAAVAYLREINTHHLTRIETREAIDTVLAALDSRERELGGIYVASRASVPERGEMWRHFRDDNGVNITSSWIDEDGEGMTASFAELWQRITDEITRSERLVLYAEQDDFPLKGALIEVGIALGKGKPITVCLPNVELQKRSCRPIGSWIHHPLVTRNDDIYAALKGKEEGNG